MATIVRWVGSHAVARYREYDTLEQAQKAVAELVREYPWNTYRVFVLAEEHPATAEPPVVPATEPGFALSPSDPSSDNPWRKDWAAGATRR
jgi:hypothetical protein